MKNININIKEFSRKYDENYQWLYNGGDRISGYQEPVDAFDEFLKTHQEFVSEFCRYIGDFISSDREAAAFALTMSDFLP